MQSTFFIFVHAPLVSHGVGSMSGSLKKNKGKVDILVVNFIYRIRNTASHKTKNNKGKIKPSHILRTAAQI